MQSQLLTGTMPGIMHDVGILRDVGYAILGAAAVGFPAYILGLPLILAYLGAGVALGTGLGFGVISDTQSIGTLSEIGLVLLMFILGLEIDLKKLLRAGKAVLVNGLTQFLGCVLLAVGFFALFGFRRFELTYLAIACALSSTLIVVKVLSDRMELDSLASRISLGILVIQDVWAIGFLAVQPNLSELKWLYFAQSLVKIGFLVFTSWAMARFVLPRVFERIGKHPELMLVTSMAWCFGMCGLAFSLQISLEMGALVAGVSVASFPYHLDIASKISSLRDFFLTLFFVALGLQIPKPTWEIIALAGGIVVFVSLSRFLTVFPTLYALKYGNRASFVPALNLSQVSEFALVLTALGVSFGHIDRTILSSFVLAFATTALISSFAIPNAYPMYRALAPLFARLGIRDQITEKKETLHEEVTKPKLVFLGFYRSGSSLLEELRRRHTSEAMKQVLVVDYSPESHQALRAEGIACVYSDISHVDTLRHLDLTSAEVILSTIPDHQLKGITNLKLLYLLQKVAPHAKIIVTAETFQSAKEMYAQGASYVLLPRLVTAHYLADILEAFRSDSTENIRQGAMEHLAQWKEVLP